MMGEDEYDEFDDYYDDDDEFGDFDGYVNYLRHEFCYDEFAGFGEEYDGPKGILTSFLPDGTSTSPRKTSKNEGQQQKEKNADSGKTLWLHSTTSRVKSFLKIEREKKRESITSKKSQKGSRR